MTLPVEINPLLASSSSYTIARSLRLRSSASAYFNKTPSVTGSLTTYTLSCWVKRGTITSDQTLISSRNNGGNGVTYLYFDTSDKLHFYDRNSSLTVQGEYSTNAVFRDPSAWYHVVCVVNTTQATAANRFSIYINGVQQTLTTSTAFAQNTTTLINASGQAEFVGSMNPTYGAFFDGYLAEYNFIDGLALTPSSFGYTDNNGIWQPKAYKGTYGTNGFYLKFSDASSSIPFSYYGNFSGASRLAVPVSSAFDLGSAYCVEAWIYPTVSGVANICGRWYSGASNEWLLYQNGTALSGGANANYNTSSASGVLTLNAWQHVAMSWDGTTKRLFVNGVIVATSTSNNSVAGSSSLGCYIGSNNDLTSPFTGRISNVRVVKGFAVYTAAFTPPTSSLTAITGTQLLTLQGATIVDNSTNAFTITNTSTTTTAMSTPILNIGLDSSGLYNNWNPNNISVTAGVTYDSMLDTPTVGTGSSNYCVLNPLSTSNVYKPYDGNISYSNQSGATNWASSISTIGMTSGKWYFETKISSASTFSNTYVIAGIQNMFVATDTYMGISASSWGWQGSATKYNAATGTAYGTAASNGDTIMVAFDADAGSLWFGLNGTWFASGSPSTGTNPSFSSIPSGTYAFAVSSYSPVGNYGIHNATFGQRPFTYTPPTGFLALNTYNLPTPTVLSGAQYMAASTYTGTGTTQSIVNSGNNLSGTSFKPDLVWLKNRSSALHHYLNDSVRGVYKTIYSSLTNQEFDGTSTSDGVSAFNNNGFTLLNGTNVANYNASANTYVGWQWAAGQGTTSVNTSGTITSNVSVNQSAGFSIVTYTGNGVNGASYGHGLGVTPKFIISKSRNNANADAGYWDVYHSSLASQNTLFLHTTGATTSAPTVWISAPTSTIVNIGNGSGVNAGSSATYVAYCWSEVAGYSKFGSYTGNGAADGPFVYCGFRPRFVLIKDITSAVTNWQILDTSRDTYNQAINTIPANALSVEAAYGSGYGLDITSNGFKIRLAGSPINISTDTHIFAAFAENPFKISRAR